jgi:RNA polymerase sigma factor (sigma-70 family)
MPTSPLSDVLYHLRRTVLPAEGAELSDEQLLGEYLQHRDKEPLSVLVRRHGPMVWGVCRRILDAHDAEDAFQATFLVLVRRAGSIWPRSFVGNWLHGVAYQTARKARAMAANRARRERVVAEMPEPTTPTPPREHELLPLLDEALIRLPSKYRAPVVLCDLEGKTRQEAAGQLGVPPGTVAGRLARARTMLARSLARQGVALSAGTLATVLAQQSASATVPGNLVAATIDAAELFATGAVSISPQVLTLTEGVLKAMVISKIKIATVVLLAFGILGTGAGWLTHVALADKPKEKPGDKPAGKPVKVAVPQDQREISGVVHAIDVAKKTLTIHAGKAVREDTFTLAGDVSVLLDDGTGDKLGFQDGKLANVTEGASVTVRLTADKKVTRIFVEGPTVQGTLKSADAGKAQITVTIASKKGEAAEEKTFSVTKNARLFIDDGHAPDKTKPGKEVTLQDFPQNAPVVLRLSADQKAVGSLRAESPSVSGTVKKVDADKITVTISAKKGEDATEQTFAVGKDVPVSFDEGKSKDKTKPAEAAVKKLNDVPVSARVRLRLTFDRGSVTAIAVEPTTAHGSVKAVDAEKGTITLHDKVDGDKTYTVAKDAAVYFDDKSQGAKKLSDVPTDAQVELRMPPGGTTVQTIRVQPATAAGTISGNAGKDITVHSKAGDETFALDKDVRIVLDGNRPGKVEDLVDGAVVRVRLSVDRKTALEVQAEGPTYRGIVKGVDADKITLTVGGKGGVGGEDKEFKLTKKTVIATQMKQVPIELKNLKVDTEVTVKLSLDQKTAVQILVMGE